MLKIKEEFKMTEESRRVDGTNKEFASLKYAKTVEVNGIEYVLQKLPTMEALKIRQQARSGGDYDDIKMYQSMLEHVVIKPKMTIQDFADVIDLEDLMEEVLNYQYKSRGK